MFFLLIVNCTSAFAFSCEEDRPIIQMPITFDQTRIQLTKNYLLKHYEIKADTIEIIPKIIVLHWTEVATLSGSFNAYKQPTLSAKHRPDLSDELNISAHFLVDRDGTIYQLMPENWMARHVIGLNYYSIGIENVGGVNRKADLTREQAEANAYLVCYLRKRYPSIHYLIGHKDYLNFKGTSLWLEMDPNYQNIKEDPGEDFTNQVRKLVSP